LEILHNLKERVESQVKEFDAGNLVVVGAMEPIMANLKHRHVLHAQLLDIDEAIGLMLTTEPTRDAFADDYQHL